jgi:outer membrane protein
MGIDRRSTEQRTAGGGIGGFNAREPEVDEGMMHHEVRGRPRATMTRAVGVAGALVLPLAILLIATAPVAGQQVPETLTLAEALELARENNPAYLSQANDLVSAQWSIRSAYGDLLPTANASMGMGYTASGERRFGTVGLGEQPAMYSSNYNIGFNYSLSGARLLEPTRARAQQRATAARVEGAGSQLEANVTQAYLSVLQADAAAVQAAQEVERTTAHIRLAQARLDVGTGTRLDVLRAEVQHGQAEVRVVQAENTAAAQRLSLGQLLGVTLPEDVTLTTGFELFEPSWDRNEVVRLAMANNPMLRAAQAQAEAMGTALRVARTEYLPSLSASLGFRGDLAQAANINPLVEGDLGQMARSRQNCLDQNVIRQSAGLAPLSCPDPTDPQVRTQLEQQYSALHSGFPFSWRSQPMSASLTVSIPVFTGLNRQQRVEEANLAVQDARHTVRSEELRVQAEAETLLRNVSAAYRTARLQARVRETAAEELRLAEEQYRSGLATTVEVTDAQTNLSEAERAEIAAVHDYHQSLAALEALVGAPLR